MFSVLARTVHWHEFFGETPNQIIDFVNWSTLFAIKIMVIMTLIRLLKGTLNK